jgi:hypothetical protein
MVTSRNDAVRQRHGAQLVHGYRSLADEDSVRTQQRHDQWCKLGSECPAGRELSGRGVEMSERHAAGKPLAGGRQCLAHITEQEEFGRREAIGMGGHFPLANIDFAVREELAKMIISPAVAEAELKHFAI